MDRDGFACSGSRVVAEGARFETTDTPETIDLDLLLSFQSQSVTDELEADESPIKTDPTR
jgi:hypothetical protein